MFENINYTKVFRIGQADFGDIAESDPDHCNKANMRIKEVR